MMKNEVALYIRYDLIGYDPFLRDQIPIYLVLNWEDETVTIELRSPFDGIPVKAHNNLMTYIRLPHNVDSLRIYNDIEDLMPYINEIYKGFEIKWNGSNLVGSFDESSYDRLMSLIDDIRNMPEEFFHLIYDPVGFFHASDYFDNFVIDGLTSETNEDEIRSLSEKWEDDLAVSGIYIIGGVDEIIKQFIYLQDRLGNDKE